MSPARNEDWESFFAAEYWRLGPETRTKLIELLPEDWTSIARAFGENGDLRFAEETRESFRRLFSRIANLQ